jgi:hypothetical protein
MSTKSKGRRDGNAARKQHSFREGSKPVRVSAQVRIPTGPQLEDGWLTQYGTDYFREVPRFEKPEVDVSVFLGKLSLRETVYAMLGRPPAEHHRHRQFQVTKLVTATYRCLDTASPASPKHASILGSCDGDLDVHKEWWSNPGRKTLESIAEDGE